MAFTNMPSNPPNFFRSPQVDAFLPKSLIQLVVFSWGLVFFFPVGMSYLSALVLILCMLLQAWQQPKTLQARWQQVRQHASFWPLCIFVAWTLVTLVFQPRYPETSSNLFHGLRIVLTIVILLMLHQNEIRSAILGWVVGCLMALGIIYLNALVTIPPVAGLRDLLSMNGNKSIGIAISLAIFACCSLVYALTYSANRSSRLAALLTLLIVPALIWMMPSRTSLILILVALFVGFAHHYCKKPTRLVISFVALIMMGLVLAQIPQVQNRFTKGFVELDNIQNPANLSNPDAHHASWAMRLMLYKHTSQMIIEKPLTGWGIGSWNEQWRQRTPKFVHETNMPHNDFLWMGAQAGILGFLALLVLILSLLHRVLQIPTFAATCSIMATSGLLVAISLNNALRDAQIGMSLLFVVVALNAWALAGGKQPLN